MKRHLHLVELRVLPLVHGDGAHEGEVDAEAAVLPAALQADPDAVGHRHPLRVVGAALEAPLKCENIAHMYEQISISWITLYIAHWPSFYSSNRGRYRGQWCRKKLRTNFDLIDNRYTWSWSYLANLSCELF